MEQNTQAFIEDARRKLDTIVDSLTVADFTRLHAKFTGCVVALEVGFKRRFPEEYEKWDREFYGDDQLPT